MREGAGEPDTSGWLADEREFVLGICRGVCGPQLAEDACQEAFARAWQALERGVQPDHRRAWLATIARRAALDLARAERSVRASSSSESLGGDSAPGTIRSAEQEAMLRERVRAILAAAGELPPRQRQALMMRELEGASYRTIVKRLGAESTAAVRELIRRARIRLRRAALGVVQLSLPTAPRESLARLLASGGEPSSVGSSGAALAKLAAFAAAGSVVVGARLLEHTGHLPGRSLASDARPPAAVHRAPARDGLVGTAHAKSDGYGRLERAVATNRAAHDNGGVGREQVGRLGPGGAAGFDGRAHSQLSDDVGDHGGGGGERRVRDHDEAEDRAAEDARSAEDGHGHGHTEDGHAADASGTPEASAFADAREGRQAAPDDSSNSSESPESPENRGSSDEPRAGD